MVCFACKPHGKLSELSEKAFELKLAHVSCPSALGNRQKPLLACMLVCADFTSGCVCSHHRLGCNVSACAATHNFRIDVYNVWLGQSPLHTWTLILTLSAQAPKMPLATCIN
eukprot:m.206030 g.206030  ORF g.206030 m.206030 type:complete len:112 (-) comp15018_c1_seq5:1594-1929(-)